MNETPHPRNHLLVRPVHGVLHLSGLRYRPLRPSSSLKELFVKPVKWVLPPDSDLPEVTLFITAFNRRRRGGRKRWRTASPWTTLRTNSASSG